MAEPRAAPSADAAGAWGPSITPPAVADEPLLDLEWTDLASADLWNAIFAVEQVRTVRYLRLRNTRHTDARTLVRLAEVCPDTRVLELRACPQLLGRDLKALRSFRHLTAVKLGDNDQLDDTAVEGLLGCPALTFVELVNDTGLSGGAIGRLAQLTKLEGLLLGGATGVDDDCVRRLSTLTELRDLRLARCPVGDRAVAELGRCRRLRHLNLVGCERLGDAGVDAVSRCAGLIELRLSGCHALTDAAWQPIGRLGCLRALSLSGARALGDDEAAVLARLGQLEEFRARGCPRLGDGAATALSRCQRLQVLDAAGWEGLSRSGVAALADLPELRECGVSGLDDGGLEAIGRARGLRVLALRGCGRVTARGLGRLAGLANLEQLALLDGTPADAAMLESLRALPALREVVVDRPPSGGELVPGEAAAGAGSGGLPFRVVENLAGDAPLAPRRLIIARD